MSGYEIQLELKPRRFFGGRKLGESAREELAYAMQAVIHGYLDQNLTLPAEKKVLELLDDVVDIDCEGGQEATISFVFQEHWILGAVCGRHWYAHAMAARWDELGALFAQHAQRIAGRRPAAASEYGPQSSYVLALWDDNILAVDANGNAVFSGGNGEDVVLTYDSEVLDEASGLLARELYETGLCRCSLCMETRPASVAGKAAERRRPKDADLPAWRLAMRAAERGDLETLDRLIAGDEYAVERSFEAGVQSPGAIAIRHLLARGHQPPAMAVANAARLNAVEALRLMHVGGADLEAHDSIGRTPLANAAAHGCVDAVRFLLDAGAKVNAKTSGGDTALLLAFGSENANPEAVVGMLVAAGADVEAKSGDGRGVVAYLALMDDEARRAAFWRGLRKA